MQTLTMLGVNLFTYKNVYVGTNDLSLVYTDVEWLIPTMQYLNGKETQVNLKGEVWVLEDTELKPPYDKLPQFVTNLIDLPQFAYILTKIMNNKPYGDHMSTWID